VKVMGKLYAWSEVIARGMENHGIEDDERVLGHSAGKRDPNMTVADAAKQLCECFGDEKATSDCEELAATLRALVEEGRSGIVGIDDRGSFGDFGDAM
jgi:hypothetical protein